MILLKKVISCCHQQNCKLTIRKSCKFCHNRRKFLIKQKKNYFSEKLLPKIAIFDSYEVMKQVFFEIIAKIKQLSIRKKDKKY